VGLLLTLPVVRHLRQLSAPAPARA
jgi:hypothetical protein